MANTDRICKTCNDTGVVSMGPVNHGAGSVSDDCWAVGCHAMAKKLATRAAQAADLASRDQRPSDEILREYDEAQEAKLKALGYRGSIDFKYHGGEDDMRNALCPE